MLISNLSKRIVNVPFEGIESLIYGSNFKIAVLPGSAQMDFFRYTSNPAHKEAWQERIEPYMDTTIDFLQGE